MGTEELRSPGAAREPARLSAPCFFGLFVPWLLRESRLDLPPLSINFSRKLHSLPVKKMGLVTLAFWFIQAAPLVPIARAGSGLPRGAPASGLFWRLHGSRPTGGLSVRIGNVRLGEILAEPRTNCRVAPIDNCMAAVVGPAQQLCADRTRATRAFQTSLSSQ